MGVLVKSKVNDVEAYTCPRTLREMGGWGRSNKKEEEIRLSEYPEDKLWLLKEEFLFVLVNNECLKDLACFAGKQHLERDSDSL